MSDMTQPIMTCDWCGKDFPADPRACLEAGFEAGFEAELPDDEGEEWKREPIEYPIQVTPGERSEMKLHMGLDDAQLDELLATGKVEGLGSIVCVECQDEATEASDGEDSN